MSQWDDRHGDGGGDQGRYGQEDRGWTAPGSGSAPLHPAPVDPAREDVTGYRLGEPVPYAAGAPPVTAPAGGAFHRIGPGGVPELWPGPIPLRPLSFGEILECAFRVMRFNPKTLFGLTFVVLAVFTVLATVLTFAVLAAVVGPADLFAMSEDGSSTASVGVQLANFGLGLIAFFLSGLLVAPIAESALGRRLSPGESWGRVKGRLGALFGYLVLSWLISLAVLIPVAVALGAAIGTDFGTTSLVFLFLMIPLTLVAYVWVLIKLSLAPSAIVLEGVGPVQALKRSWALTKGVFWRTLGILFVVNLIASLIAGLLMGVFMVGMVAVMIAVADNEVAAGITMVIVTSLITLVTYTISLPFSAAANALVYLDRRFRTEALAVDLLAEAERERTSR